MSRQKLLLCIISSLFTLHTNAASNFRIACLEKDQDVLVAEGDRDLAVLELNEPMNVSSEELERLFYRGPLDADFRLTRYRGVEQTDNNQSLIELARSMSRDQQRSQPIVVSDSISLGFAVVRFEDIQGNTPENERFIRFESFFDRNQTSTSMGIIEFSSRSFHRPFARAESTRFYICSSPEFYEVSFGDGDQSQSSGSDIDAQF
jgi:hypothetical protein